MHKLKAVILAGGKGTRLRPITSLSPKPMAKILNKPCIGHVLDLLKSHNITDAAVTVGYKPQRLTDYLNERTDMNIKIFKEDSPLGTAGSVKQCEDFLDGDFLVISGDCVCDIDLDAAIAFHKERGGIATIITVNGDDPTGYGLVFSDASGKIIRFDEKPGWERVAGNRINTGIYILKKEILGFVPSGEYDFASQLFPLLISGGRAIYEYHSGAYWCDIGTPSSLMECNFHLLDEQEMSLSPTGKARLIAPYFIGENCRISNDAMIGPYAVIGDNVEIGSGAKLYNCVVDDGVIIENNARVQGMVCAFSHICSGASVGAHTVVGEGCRLGNESRAEGNIRIFPGLTVADKTGVNISLVYDDRGAGLFSERGIEGDIRDEITPVFLTRLGMAFASAFSDSVIIAYGDDRSLLLAESAAMGAGASGLRPLLAKCGLYSAKFACAKTARPCIYILRDGNKVRILSFYAGMPLNYIQERKITNAFLSDEMKCADIDDICMPERLLGAEKEGEEMLNKILKGAFLEDFSVLFDEAGEDLRVESDGMVLEKESILALICLFEKGRDLPLPDWAPVFLLQKAGITFHVAEEGDFVKYPYFFDNVYMAARLAGIMKSEGKELRELYSMLPRHAVCRRRLTGTHRASVIASLNKLVPYSDITGKGISMNSDEGRITVVPLRRAEGFDILAFSGDSEVSKELCADMCDIIKSIDSK